MNVHTQKCEPGSRVAKDRANALPNDSKQAKVQARRDQIVEAAKTSFRRHGFHAASMAEIAQGSQLSVGQIYRYFANKDAIIEEIVNRIIASKMQRLENLGDHINLIAGTLAARTLFQQPGESETDHMLMLEVTAEATRNPVVAKCSAMRKRGCFATCATTCSGCIPISARKRSPRGWSLSPS